MDCVSCDSETDYNRVAVDRPSGEISGAICVRCGAAVVSRSADAPGRTMATCAVCGDASDVLFPKWDSIVETDDGPETVEYTVELTTPALCERCLAADRRSTRIRASDGGETDS